MEKNGSTDHSRLLPDGEFVAPPEPRHPSADVAVEGPNSAPTGSRFETSSVIYAAGFPDVELPEWLNEEAERLAELRRAKDHTRELVPDMTTEESLMCLEAMSRRITAIGDEREANTPLIEGVPVGKLGGQLAILRRTILIRPNFYFYNPDAARVGMMEDGFDHTVPMLPMEELKLQERINALGHNLLKQLV